MEKIKITKEQEEALNILKLNGITLDVFINCEARGKWVDDLKPLNNITPEQFALLLFGWYEVEQPFKVGDWVKQINSEDYSKVTNEHFDNSWGLYEKVTEPWKIMLLELGRDKPELKRGDYYVRDDGFSFTVEQTQEVTDSFIEGRVEYFYPVESRIEVNER